MNSKPQHFNNCIDRQSSPHNRENRPVAVGELISPVVENVRFRRNVDAIHQKGPRLIYELLKEIGAHSRSQGFINQRAEVYAGISGDALDVTDGRDLPPTPLHPVSP